MESKNIFSLYTAAAEEVGFPFLLQPTVIEGLEHCDPSYTMDALNELDMKLYQILMELSREQNN